MRKEFPVQHVRFLGQRDQRGKRKRTQECGTSDRIKIVFLIYLFSDQTITSSEVMDATVVMDYIRYESRPHTSN